MRLLQRGELDRAERIIKARIAVAPKDVEALFLEGMITTARQDYRSAIAIFRSLLIDHPGATRVRLELARAFYLDKDYGNALRQFQFALAGNPPVEVVANINRYMAAIRDAKSLSYNIGIAVAPDTNLNAGSSAREVTLFGLPFDLSDDARKRSGVGLAIEAGAEWAPRIGKGKRLRLGMSAQRREYARARFGDMTLAAYGGPRLVAGKWDVSLLGTTYQRWYASKPYNHAAGARLEATYHLNSRLGIAVALANQRVSYRSTHDRNSVLTALSGTTFYALTASSGINLKAGVSRERARLGPYSNWSGFAAAGYYRDLPMGFSAYVEPSVSVARFDQASVGFGRRRSDSTQSLSIILLNRRLVMTRFTPRISYTFTRQASSIPFYAFTRSRFEIGLTTVF